MYKRIKTKHPVTYVCFGCNARFTRIRGLHKHQGVLWPYCKAVDNSLVSF